MNTPTFNRRTLLRMAGLSGLGLLAAACAAPTTTTGQSSAPSTGGNEPRYGGTLRVGIQAEPENLGFVSGDTAANVFMFKLFEPMVELGPNNTLLPRLAESWQVVDAKTLVFKMRKGVKFHDGSAMTMDDVKFSLDLLRDAAQSRSASLLTSIDTVAIKDETTVQLNLKLAYAPLLANLATPASLVFPQALYTKADKSFATKPVGTGPYKLTEVVTGDHTTYTRFDGYWGKKPYLDTIELKLVPDENVKLINLRTDNLDIIDTLPPKDVKAVEADQSFTVVSLPKYGYRSLRMHTKLEPFTNKALRQAIQLAIDPKPIVRAIYFDAVDVSYGPIGVDMIGFDPNFKGIQPDKAKAKAKLVEGGQPNGFSFTVTVPNAPSDVQLAQAIAAQLADVGITMNIEQVDRGVYTTRLLAKQLVASLGGNLSGRAEADATLALYYRAASPNNFNGYANPAVEDLLLKAQEEQDKDKRIALYRQIQTMVVD